MPAAAAAVAADADTRVRPVFTAGTQQQQQQHQQQVKHRAACDGALGAALANAPTESPAAAGHVGSEAAAAAVPAILTGSSVGKGPQGAVDRCKAQHAQSASG
jgi:hypothetical protein